MRFYKITKRCVFFSYYDKLKFVFIEPEYSMRKASIDVERWSIFPFSTMTNAYRHIEFKFINSRCFCLCFFLFSFGFYDRNGLNNPKMTQEFDLDNKLDLFSQ